MGAGAGITETLQSKGTRLGSSVSRKLLSHFIWAQDEWTSVLISLVSICL